MGGLAMRQLPLAFAVLFFCALAGHTQEPPKHDFELFFGDLWIAYDDNAIAAEQKYGGKKLLIKGLCHEIKRTDDGRFYATFGLDGPAGLSPPSCFCFFAKNALADAAKLKALTRIQLVGTLKGTAQSFSAPKGFVLILEGCRPAPPPASKNR
jgi:hypothetical protein